MALRSFADGVIGIVCDGVSTSERPDEASCVAADTAAELLRVDDPERSTIAAMHAAAQAVSELATEDTESAPPACTYVSAVVTADTVTVGWIGDSRAYWLAGTAATPSACLTVDDSFAAELVTGGVDAERAYASPYGHTITGWLGANAGDISPHVTSFRPSGPGIVLICSDGLWNYRWEADALADSIGPLPVAAPLEAARTLVQFALDSGGHDNVTVVVVPFPPAQHEKREKSGDR